MLYKQSLFHWKETLTIESKGSIYKTNKMGPKMEPWGTPQMMGAEDVSAKY